MWESPEVSLRKAKYFVSIIDDYSKRLWVYPIKKKPYMFIVFKEFKTQVELETSKRIKCLRINDGREYVDSDCLTFWKPKGIVRQLNSTCTSTKWCGRVDEQDSLG